MYYLFVGLSTALLSLGLLLIKRPFFRFALSTVALLDTMVDIERTTEERQPELISRLSRMLARFGLMLVVLSALVLVSLCPLFLFVGTFDLASLDLDTGSIGFFGAMIAGSVVLFLPFLHSREQGDYSDWDKLLHRMILPNHALSKSLFRLDRYFFAKKAGQFRPDFVVVTGLARAGTTAMTTLLHDSGRFHSLSYDNMPFLLCVNLWRKVHRVKQNELRERAHGDRLKIGFSSVEALEEYFFKVFLRDSYISKTEVVAHDVDDKVYDQYVSYLSLIGVGREDSVYLAKNNNFMLRYKSIRAHNPDFKVVLLYRRPLEQAASLLRQHSNFLDQQSRDEFVLEYMTWLGHHEFGHGLKSFRFESGGVDVEFESTSIDHWVQVWISFYGHVLSLEHDPNLLLVDYDDLAESPGQLMAAIGSFLGMDLGTVEETPFRKSVYDDVDVDQSLAEQADAIYSQLVSRKATL